MILIQRAGLAVVMAAERGTAGCREHAGRPPAQCPARQHITGPHWRGARRQSDRHIDQYRFAGPGGPRQFLDVADETGLVCLAMQVEKEPTTATAIDAVARTALQCRHRLQSGLGRGRTASVTEALATRTAPADVSQ